MTTEEYLTEQGLWNYATHINIGREGLKKMLEDYTSKTGIKEIEELKKTRKQWYENCNKIIEETIGRGSGCRDCADSNDLCSIDNLPCDPTKRIIFVFNQLQSQVKKLETSAVDFIEWKDKLYHYDPTKKLYFPRKFDSTHKGINAHDLYKQFLSNN